MLALAISFSRLNERSGLSFKVKPEDAVFAVKAKTKYQKNRKAVYANFYIGQKFYNEGKKKQAAKYFKKIFKQRYLGFYVVGAARHLLKKCGEVLGIQKAKVTKEVMK